MMSLQKCFSPFWATNPYELAAWLPLPLYILIAISAIADRSLGQGPSLVDLARLLPLLAGKRFDKGAFHVTKPKDLVTVV